MSERAAAPRPGRGPQGSEELGWVRPLIFALLRFARRTAPRLSAACSSSVLFALLSCAEAPGETAARAHVVVLTQSAGYEHEVVRRESPEQLSLVEAALAERWSSTYEMSFVRDASELSAARLEHTDVLLMYTTGELALPGGAAALVDWVEGGGALLGVHSVSDTFHEQPAFLALLGGEFAGHPWHQEVALIVESTDHPATRHLPERLVLSDEIYEYDRLEGARQTLLRLDPASVDMSRAQRPEGGHPLSWTRRAGAGRVFHTGLGHRPELWAREEFLAHLDGGLAWLLGAN